jgi:hypothetical protein
MPGSSGFQASIGIGFRAPLAGNNDAVSGGRLTVEGYQTHGWIADHFTCGSLATVYAHIALLIDLTHSISGLAHGVTISNWSCEQYNGALKCNGGGPGSGFCGVSIFLDTETASGTDPSYDVSDNGNLHGVIHITDAGGRTSRTPVISNGAPALRVVNDMIGHGHWASPPAVPATTVAQQNTSWRDATVTVATGAGVTVSAIAVDGTATGASIAASSSYTVRVPSGKNITLTYTGGTPTWVWVLD